MSRSQRRTDIAGSIVTGVGALAGTVLAAGGGWIVYSNNFINHNVPLMKAIQAEARTLSSDDIGSLNIYVDRNASGRPLLLIHSVNAAASSYEMGPIFDRYRESRPVFALDLPGFGFSDRSDRLYTPRLYQEAILEALRTEVQEPADVVALSLGCEFAARAAVIEPERFHSLTFISPTGFGEKSADRNSHPTEVDQQSDRVHNLLSQPLWSKPLFDLIATKPSIRYFLQMSFVGPVPQGMIDYDYATSHQPGGEHAPLYFISGKLFTPGILPAFYERLEMPVLVLYDQDAFTGFSRLPEVVNAHENWQSNIIAPTRGLPQFEQMDAVAAALGEFWSSIES